MAARALGNNAVALTDAKLKGLKPVPGQRVEISDLSVPGMRVRVGAGGSLSFIVRKRVGDKLKVVTLGSYGPRFGLADARKQARQVLSDIEAGGDPATSRRAAKRAGGAKQTIRAMLPHYYEAKADRRSIGEIRRILDGYVVPVLGDRLADAVTRGDVSRLIDDIAARAPVQARNVHAQLSAFYSWAMPRLDRLAGNPCRDAGRPGKPKPRQRVLSDIELAALWRVAEREAMPWSAGLKLLILTGQRKTEVFAAGYDEFDRKAATWTIPAARAKNGVEHLVPLSPAALAVLKPIARAKDSAQLFPAYGNGDASPSGFSRAVRRFRRELVKELGVEPEKVPDWTLHDIRRTVATGLQRLGVRVEVTEAVLNHVSGTRAGIARVYQRHDYAAEKREALDLWAKEVARLVKRKRGAR